MRKGSSLNVTSGSNGVRINLRSKSAKPSKGSTSSPKPSALRRKAAFIFLLDNAIILRLATAVIFRLDTAIIFRLDAAIISRLDTAIIFRLAIKQQFRNKYALLYF